MHAIFSHCTHGKELDIFHETFYAARLLGFMAALFQINWVNPLFDHFNAEEEMFDAATRGGFVILGGPGLCMMTWSLEKRLKRSHETEGNATGCQTELKTFRTSCNKLGSDSY